MFDAKLEIQKMVGDGKLNIQLLNDCKRLVLTDNGIKANIYVDLKTSNADIVKCIRTIKEFKENYNGKEKEKAL